MSRDEFFKKIADMNLHIEYDQHFLYVLDKDNFLLASISTVYTYQFSFCQTGLCGLSDSDCVDFIKLVVDFVCSGEDRKKEKRFFLRHKFLYNSGDFNYFNVRREDGHTSLGTYFQTEGVQSKFTQMEIDMMKMEYDTDFSDFELLEVETEEYGVRNYEN